MKYLFIFSLDTVGSKREHKGNFGYTQNKEELGLVVETVILDYLSL